MSNLANETLFGDELRKMTAGQKAQSSGASFEDEIDRTLDFYRDQQIAFIERLPVPTAPSGQVHRGTGQPLLIRSGKAPFDLCGYTGPTRLPSGRFVGVELKRSSDRATSLSIVPDTRRPGVAIHQLDALASVAMRGGHAFLLWDNCGEVGAVGNEALIVAHHTYLTNPNRGSKSIPWSAFQSVPLLTHRGWQYLDFLSLASAWPVSELASTPEEPG